MTITCTRLFAAVLAAALSFSTIAQGMSEEEYAAKKDAISSAYHSARSACESQPGNATNICMADAMGKNKVAKAELESRYRPGYRTLYKLRVALSGAAYSVAWQKCNDLAGTMRNVCIQEARSAETTALASAMAEMKISRKNANAAEISAKAQLKAKANTYGARQEADKQATIARVEAKTEATEARNNVEAVRREAVYAVEKEKCETFAGDVKKRCLADAKRRNGQS